MSNILFPNEILELIVGYLDGRSLLNTRLSCQHLCEIVDSVAEKKQLWRISCHKEIPLEQLAEIIPKYEKYEENMWLHIYENWLSWQTSRAIVVEPQRCREVLKKISCMAVSRDNIALGSENGVVKVLTTNWSHVLELRPVAGKLTNIEFIGNSPANKMDPCLFVSFHNGICIMPYDGVSKDHPTILLGVKSHSIYQNYICVEKVGGRMSILQIGRSREQILIKEVWFARIYSPRCVTAYKIWNGKCTFLISSTIFCVNYLNPNVSAMEQMEKVVDVEFHAPMLLDRHTTHILRDNVIINLYEKADKSNMSPDIIEDYVEIIIIESGKNESVKLFNAWDLFRTTITCIFLYGNCFLIGTVSGCVYMYSIDNWRNFDLKNYTSKLIIGRHPIKNIKVKEIGTERVLYAYSRFDVHEIHVWAIKGCWEYECSE